MPDITKPVPLHIDVNHPDHADIIVYFNGKRDGLFIEVDVLGCWGVRIATDEFGVVMRDDDNCVMHERVYGTFRLEWKVTRRTLTAGGGNGTFLVDENGMFRFKDWSDHG